MTQTLLDTEKALNHADGLGIIEAITAVRDAIAGESAWETGIFGFIEHCDTLDPASRIEYIEENKDFSPIAVDLSTGAFTLNDWEDFPWIKENLPYMVNLDGTPDYQLDPDDYTKKLDGSASDVANTSYAGAGAFSYARKIYKHEYMIGNDRYVKFSFTKYAGFEATGFIVGSDERDGAWIPMFYPVNYSGVYKVLATGQGDCSVNTATQWTRISAIGANARFLGGPLMETLIDLMIMFAKTTELQGAYGYGNRSGYDSTDTSYYGKLANAVVNGGQFYGTNTGKALNKVFHSIVLITQNMWIRDPYELVVNGRVKVSTDFTYDLTGDTYEDTGIDVPYDGSTPASGWKYPHIYETHNGYGGVPIIPGSGSTALGGCDGVYESASQASITAVSLRFADCNDGSDGGPRARNWNYAAGNANWSISCAPVLFKPVS